MKKDIVIVDLEGTITISDQRSKRFILDPQAAGGEADWDGFWADAKNDPPNIPVISTVRALSAVGYKIYIFSARCDSVSQDTEEWLEKYGVPYDLLYLRMKGDHRNDTILKKQWMRDLGIADYVALILEDRARVVDMWRNDFGFTCFQVAAGDF